MIDTNGSSPAVLRGGRTFKRGKHVLTSASLAGLCLTQGVVTSGVMPILSLTAMPAQAACTPGDIGTAGNDTITCDVANPPDLTIVDGLGGNDTITLDGITAPTVVVRGDTGMDTIDLINGAEVFSIEGENDVDTINLTNGTVTNVNWGAGDEGQTLNLTNVTVNGSLTFGSGMDTFTLTGGTVGQSVVLGTGVNNDTAGNTFTLDGGTIGLRIDGGNFADTINLNSGDVFEVRTGDGGDTINLVGSATVYRIFGQGGVDIINLTSGTVTTDVDWGAGDETYTLNLTGVTLGGNIVMGTGMDNFTHVAGHVGANVLLGSSANNDTDGNIFTLNGGTIGQRIDGGSQADTINLNSGTVGSTVNGFNGADTINLVGNATVASIDGGADVDLINLDSGTVTGNVNWGHGDETYTLDLTNVTLGGSIFMGGGMDDFTFIAGTVGVDVYLGLGNNNDSAGNIFTLAGGTITQRIWGGNFVDTINLNSGNIGSIVYGNSGADEIYLGTFGPGTATVGGIDGGPDVDLIQLDSGTVTGNVSWGAGDETYTLDLTNVTLGGNIIMGAGMDNFTHTAGHVGGSVILGIGPDNGTDPDTFTLAGGTIGSRIDGDRGVDTINLNDGSVAGQVRGLSGDDVIELMGTATVGGIQGGSGVDSIILHSGTVTSHVDWGAGDENTNEILDLTNVNLTGSLIFGTGSDEFTLRAGTVGTSVILGVNANSGNDADTFNMEGGTINSRIEGDLGADTLNLTGGEVLNGTSVRTFGGNDVINLDGTILHGGIDAGAGSDTINLISGGVTLVNAGAGNDTGVLDLTNVTVGNSATPGISGLIMGAGSDNFTLNAGVINGAVILGTGANAGTDADIFTMNGGTITSRIEGDQGDDTINLNGGTVQNATSLRGFAGNDTVNLNGATLDGNIDTGDDNDIFNWTDGTMGPLFTGNRGNDAANISSATYTGTTILDGGQFNTFSFVDDNGTPLDPLDDFTVTVTDTFVDTLTFSGANANVNANTIRGWEVVSAVDSTLVFDTLLLNGVNMVNNNNVATALNVTRGDVTLSGASVLADLLGSIDNEILTVTSTTLVSNNIEGAGGADTISVTGDASVTGTVFGGAAGHDSSAAADTGDTITLDTTGAVGAIDGGLGDDAINLVAGTVNTNVLGGAGDDTVTVFDTFTAVTGIIDGGANTGPGDTFVVDTVTGRTFDGSQVANFENLRKDNTGVLTLTGAHDFTGMATINGGTLDVDGTLTTPNTVMMGGTVLNVDGTVQGNAVGGETQITGSSGVETIVVAAGGRLDATGNLGDGADVLDVIGTLDTGTGIGAEILSLGLGDDIFTIHDNTTVTGTVDGGAGTDTFNTNINGIASVGAVTGFETLLKTGTGTLNITGPAASSFNTVNVNNGLVDVTGAMGITGISSATVLATGRLNVDGPISFTSGADSFTVAGTVTGTDTIDMLGGNDTFTFQEGASISAVVDGGAGTDTLDANILTNGTLARAVNFETLTKTGAGILNITGPGTSDFSTVNVNEGVLDVDATVSNVSMATVQGGATIDLAGSFLFTPGADTFDVSGILTGAGTFDMLAGQDTLILRDGADLSGLTNAIDGGDPSAGVGDTVVVDNTGTLAFDGSDIVNFESLRKDNVGTLELTGTQSFTGGTTINGGTLDVVAGSSLGTPTLAMADGATFDVNGTADNGTGGQMAMTGSAGVNTINVAGLLRASGDLGGGADVLDVTGTLDTGGGTLSLGDGSDTFTIHDNTVVAGTVDGGLGTDTFNTNITTTADLGAATGFEVLDKTGGGTLNITGPAVSAFDTVRVTAGTLDVNTNGSITNVGAATVSPGATLNLAGSFGFTPGNDTFDIMGRLTGGGTFDMLAGQDTLTLSGAFDLSGFTGQIDGGDPTTSPGDTVVVDTAANVTFDGANIFNFEALQKDNTGTLTLTGSQTFVGGTTINGGTLDVAAGSSLGTPTLAMADGTIFEVNGTANDGAGGQMMINGSSGANRVNVSAGASLLATGDLGGGADVLDVAGTLDTGAGTFFLGDGDDTFIVHDTTVVIGALDAGLGNDTLNVNVSASNLVPLGATTGFESLAKSGLGTLQINGPSSFIDVDVQAGRLEITATGSVAAQNTVIAAGAALQLDGPYAGTAGADTFDVAGMVSGGGGVDLGDGDDVLTLRDGADLSGLTSPIDGGAHTGGDTVVVDTTGTVTFDGSQVVNFETLQKDNIGTLTLTGAQSFSGGTTINGGTLDVDGTLGTPTITMTTGGTVLNIDGTVNDGAGGETAITGSSGIDTIIVAGTLNATGTLGDGNDVLNVAGTIDTGTGTGTLTLGVGDDTLTINDGAIIMGIVDGGDGTDTFNTNINTMASLGSVTGFETLTKTGVGVLNVTGPGTSTFDTVNVTAGTLDVNAAGSIANVSAATVAAGATLNLAGGFGFTPGDDTFTVAGRITGANTVDMLDGDDMLTLRGTADISGFTGTFDGGGHGTGDTFTIDGWSGTLPGTRTLNWETVAVDNSANVNFGPSLGVGTGAGMGLIVGSGSTASGDAIFALTGDLTTNAGGTFTNHGGGGGNVSISGDVTNNGTISMRDGAAGDTMAVGGNYAGTGVLRLDVDFSASTADKLIITGDVTPGRTTIFVADISSSAASGDDILLVDVTGSTSNGDFQLDGGTINAGNLTYGLNLVGSQWFLQPLLLPQNLIYEAYPRNLQALNTMRTHRQRVQNRTWLASGDVSGEDAGFWLRGSLGMSDFDPGSSTTEQDFGTSDIDYDIDTRRFEIGLDLRLGEYGGGHLVGGVRAFQGTASLSGSSPLVDGNIDTDAIGVGASLTWYDKSDFYIDFQLHYARFDSDLTSTASPLTSGNRGTGHAASVEVGKSFSLTEGWSVTPEAQYVHYGVSFDRFTAASGETVYLEDGTTSELRLGGTLEYEAAASETSNSRFFVTANVYRQLDGRTAVNSASDTLVSETRPWRGEVGIGGSHEWRNRNGMRAAVYGDVVAGSDFGSALASGGKLNGRVGFKMEF